MTRLFTCSSRIEAKADEVYDWHARPGALVRLLPPWLNVRILERRGGLEPGGRVRLRLRRGPFAANWEAVLDECEEGRFFVDRQVRGPFAQWVHAHRFHPEDDEHCTIEDRVSYRLPFGGFGQLLGGRAVHRALKRLFRFRHDRIHNDLARLAAFRQRGPQRFVITGSSGLVGRSLAAFLTAGGHSVVRLVRQEPDPARGKAYWNPQRGQIAADALEGADAVVHLAGESIAAGRWTAAVKDRILRSRVDGTRLLSETLAQLKDPPRVLISASAIGYYGDRGDESLTEEAPPGSGFLADVCKQWEAAAKPAEQAGIRVVTLRTGFVLSAAGGAFPRMLLAFRWGLGGIAGSGRQYLSWIALDDLVGAIHHLAFTNTAGPVNAVSPNPPTSAEFTRALGAVLRRPTLFRLPAPVVRGMLGEMGEALLLSSARVQPRKLEQSGFRFLHPELEAALRSELGLRL